MESNLYLECIAAITIAKEIISCNLIPTRINAGTEPTPIYIVVRTMLPTSAR